MWFAALTLGLTGSLHCLGMCSPLVMAVSSGARFSGNALLYNGGRILTYALLGAIVGSVAYLIDLSELQVILSVSIGALLIFAGIGGLTSFNIPFLTPLINRVIIWIKGRFSKILSKKGGWKFVILGMLNGLLPCGLTYIALVFCLTLDAMDGFLYMLVFGLSTLPVMLGATGVLMKLANKLNLSFSRISVYTMIIAGLLLVFRPYMTHGHSNHNPVLSTTDNITICK